MNNFSLEKYLHTDGDSFFLPKYLTSNWLVSISACYCSFVTNLLRFDWELLFVIATACYCSFIKICHTKTVCFCDNLLLFSLLLMLLVIVFFLFLLLLVIVFFVIAAACYLFLFLLLLVIVLFVIASACYWRMQGWILVLSD